VPLPKDRELEPSLVEAYLSRLGLSRDEVSPPSLASLTTLQLAHIHSVAYENLDMHCSDDPVPPPLDPTASARRIVQGRGGYCFIIVDAYAGLLCSLGFSVSLHTASCSEDPTPREKWGNHVLCLVHMAGKTYISDVGLGDGPGSPFELKEGEWQDSGHTFRLEYRKGGERPLWRWVHDPALAAMHSSYTGFSADLSTSVMSVNEFEAYHKYYYTNKESHYRTSGAVMQLVREDGMLLTLLSCVLKLTHPTLTKGEKVMNVIQSKEEWFDTAKLVFLLSLDTQLSEIQQEVLWENARASYDAWIRRKQQSDFNLCKEVAHSQDEIHSTGRKCEDSLCCRPF